MRTTIATALAGSIIALLAALVAGCGGTAAPPPDTSGLAALDAQATLAVWSARETAVAVETRRVEGATAQAAEANAAATRSAEQATAQAIQSAGATAAAYGTAVAVEATATAGAGYMAATARAADATATRDGLAAEQLRLAIAATATADAAALSFQQAQAGKALAARQAEIDRAEMWNRILPWVVGALAAGLAAATALAAGTWAVERLRRTRPQQAGDVWVMLGPGGPVALNRPPANRPALLPAALPPAPITVSGPEAAVVLPEMRREHVLIAGETGSGKSHAMRTVLAARGERVVVLDPHYTEAEGWGAARVVGAGRDYGAIREYMGEMERMLRERYEARAAGRDRFEPLTVAVDEMPSIVDAVGRDISRTWRQWLREGRKVGLYLVLSTQSTRVRTLGIEGEADLLENFTWVLALGDVARRGWPAVTAGMARPAALVTKGRARPVVVPYVGNTIPHDPGAASAAVPLFTAPSPAAVVEPDPDNMTDADRARVVAEFRRSRSLAAVQRAVFPSYRGSGGRAFYAIKDALVAAGELPPYREDGADGLGPPPGSLYYR